MRASLDTATVERAARAPAPHSVPPSYLEVGPNYQAEWRPRADNVQHSDGSGVRLVDVNGDGLSDTLVLVPHDFHENFDPFDDDNTATLWINTGHGGGEPLPAFLPRVEDGLLEVTDTVDLCQSGVSRELFNRLRVVDFDRDGRDELISFVGDTWYVFSNVDPDNPDPTAVLFRATPLQSELPTEERFLTDGMAPMISDFDADGIVDVLSYSFDDATLRLNRGAQPERYPLLREPAGCNS